MILHNSYIYYYYYYYYNYYYYQYYYYEYNLVGGLGVITPPPARD